jgi:thimet oligopeptidase
MSHRSTLSATLAASLLLATACGPSAKPAATPASPTPTTEAPQEPAAPAQEAKPVEAAKPTPPRPPEAWLQEKCAGHLTAAREKLAQLKDGSKREGLAVLELFNDLQIELNNASTVSGLLSQVHPLAAVRDAGDKCTHDVDALNTEINLDRAVYDVVKAVDAKGLDAEAQRMLERTLRDFRRAGVDKDDKTRARLKEISDRETIVGQTFDKAIRDDVRSVKLKPAQLAGLPQDWIDAHKPDADGNVVVNTDYPDYVPFRTYASDSKARSELYQVYMNRAWPQNDEVFKELLALRQEKAKLLGYKNWADYNAEDKMIKHGDAIATFVDKITAASDHAAKRDYAVLLERKKKDDPKATAVDGSEYLYYEELVRREKYSFNAQEARKYFDFKQTEAGLLSVTGTLFGIEYKPATDAQKWAPDVDVYDVFLAGGGEKIGRIYLDLHPREGKYKHAAQFTMVSGVTGKQLPEGALVCNFPTGLMEHDDVVTMFHEFGHLMHHVLAGKHKWVRFSGVATEWDFVEAPSQMLEEWAWDVNVLQTFAKDDKGTPIPADLVKRMRAAKEFGKGYWVRTQMFYAALSLAYHRMDAAKVDSTKVVQELQHKYSVFPYVKDTHFQAAFGHLNGYSSGYYTYMWSLVIAKDLLSAFQKNGMMDTKTSYKYRDTVLVPGGAKDAADLVKDFLGRPYGFDSFKHWLDKV